MVPQQVRGDVSFAFLNTASPTFVDVLNISGSGILYSLTVRCDSAADTVQINVVADGLNIAMDNPHSGDTIYYPLQINAEADYVKTFLGVAVDYQTINLEFSTSLLVTLRRQAGSAGNVRCLVIYSLDNF